MHLSLHPSRFLLLVLTLMHLSAIITIIFLSLWSLLKTALLMCCIASLLLTIRKYAILVSPQAIIKVVELVDGSWQLIDRQGCLWQAKLQNSHLVSTFLIILNFSVNGRRLKISIPIMKDTLLPNEFRHLCMKLRLV